MALDLCHPYFGSIRLPSEPVRAFAIPAESPSLRWRLLFVLLPPSFQKHGRRRNSYPRDRQPRPPRLAEDPAPRPPYRRLPASFLLPSRIMGDGEILIRVIDNRAHHDWLKILLLVLLIAVFPPAAVAVQANECNFHVWISLFLMLFFLIPAYIHAVWYVFIRQPAELTIA
uniref:UPF0057 membrane protein n=1 Tax=Steinernema glaseri TaxID=37863 RepID=A0A1I8A5J1_9BILA